MSVKHASCCWRQAAESEVQAAQIADQHLKATYLRIAHHWSVLARSYEFVDAVERFLLDAKNTRDATAQGPNRELLIPSMVIEQMDLRDEQHGNLIMAKFDGVDGANPVGSLMRPPPDARFALQLQALPTLGDEFDQPFRPPGCI
jgi:hypothetical protein